jgi:hypothetical protein
VDREVIPPFAGIREGQPGGFTFFTFFSRIDYQTFHSFRTTFTAVVWQIESVKKDPAMKTIKRTLIKIRLREVVIVNGRPGLQTCPHCNFPVDYSDLPAEDDENPADDVGEPKQLLGEQKK